MTADTLCLLAAGSFFATGLLSGVWKYLAMHSSAGAQAPAYVDIAHRASLLYAFAALLLREFVPYSPLGARGTFWAAALPLLFFASAILVYLLHGLLRDTDNQLRRPHVLGRWRLAPAAIGVYMGALVLGEIGGFAVLFYGFLRGL